MTTKHDEEQVRQIVDIASPIDHGQLRAALDFIFTVGSISAARRALEAAGDRIKRVQE